MISKKEVEKASNILKRGNDIESAAIILEEKILNENAGETTILKIATRQAVDFINEYKDKKYLDVIREKVQANERNKQLEIRQQKVIEKLEEKIGMLEDVLDLCDTDGRIAKYKIENLKEEIEDFKKILNIMKGEE